MSSDFNFDQRNQNVQNQIIAETVTNLLIGHNNTFISSLSDTYKPYLIGLIDNLSQDSYIALSGYTTELPEQYKDVAHSKKEVREDYKNLFDVLRKYHRFVLLGDPGSGKSHVFKFMALQIAKKCLESEFKSPLPLLVDLSLWSKQTSFKDFLTNYWKENVNLTSEPFRLLEQGSVLLFLDGLNEMGKNGKSNVDEINKWLTSSNKLLKRKIFVACRKSDYLDLELGLSINGFPKVFISPLSDEQIVQMANVYLESSEKSEQFLYRYTEERFSESIRHPYTLSRLAILNKISEKHIQNPGALNHSLVKSLWRREKDKVTLKNTEDGDENDNIVFFMLGQLALRLFIENESLSFDKDFALTTFASIIAFGGSEGKSSDPDEFHLESAKEILQDAFQLGLLLNEKAKVKFSHQLIFEYFVARMFWIARQKGDDYPFEQVMYQDERNLMLLDLTNRFFSIYHSVFVQLFGIVAIINEKQAEILIYEILKVSNNPFLAIDCITSTDIDIAPVFKRIIVYELTQKFLFMVFGQIQDDNSPFSRHDIEVFRSGMKSMSIQFGMFSPVVKDFSLYLSRIYDETCFDLVGGLLGTDIWVDQGIMLGLALSGKNGLDFFVETLNDEDNDYYFKGRIARCILEFPPEQKYKDALQNLSNNKVHALGDKGIALGRLTIGTLAKQKLEEIDLVFKQEKHL